MKQRKDQDEEIDSIRRVMVARTAAEDAVFAGLMEQQLWKSLRSKAEKMTELEEPPEDETPYVRGARAVILTFQATPRPDESPLNQIREILELQRRGREAAQRGGGPEEILRYCQEAHDLASEFTNTMVIEPDLKGGEPCIRGLRITVFDVLELLAQGKSVEQILEQESSLTRSDIADCVQFAMRMARSLDRA